MDVQRTTQKSTTLALSSVPALVAVQDLLLLGYLGLVWALLQRSGGSPAQVTESYHVYGCVALVLVSAAFARGVVDVPPKIRSTIYRLALAGVLLENYLMLKGVLPLVRPDSVDARLHAIDLALFGVEPAVWMARFNVRPVVEWFSFFYFSYFAICAAYLVAVVFLSRLGRGTAAFAIGTILVYCVGQLGYMAVPAYGPVVALKDAFPAPIDGGFFWGCVSRAVAAGGAMKDVFPSLHTAAPVWFALHAFHRARTDRRFIWPARVTAFFAANIVISTMFLRWHYAIDVVAGLVLGIGVGILAPRLASWEEVRRRRAGLGGAWTFG